jgi:hypothetical protein
MHAGAPPPPDELDAAAVVALLELELLPPVPPEVPRHKPPSHVPDPQVVPSETGSSAHVGHAPYVRHALGGVPQLQPLLLVLDALTATDELVLVELVVAPVDVLPLGSPPAPLDVPVAA